MIQRLKSYVVEFPLVVLDPDDCGVLVQFPNGSLTDDRGLSDVMIAKGRTLNENIETALDLVFTEIFFRPVVIVDVLF